MKSSPKKEILVLSVLFLLALGLRLLYLSQLRNEPFFDAPIVDAEYHDKWAMAIRNGAPFHEGPYFRAPLYAYFLALVYSIFGHSYLAVSVIQLLIGSASVLLVFQVGRKIFGPAVGMVAAVLAALYGTFIYFEGELLIPVLILFLNLVMFLTVLSSAKRPAYWRWLGCGILLGLSAIARPNVLIFLGALIPWMLVRLRRSGVGWAKLSASILSLLSGVLLMILPVTVRNYVVGQDFVPIASQGGVNFYIGNNPEADGVTAIVPGTREDFWGGYWDAVGMAEEAEGGHLLASEISSYWFRRGLAFWRQEPGAALRLTLRKLALFWGGAEIANNKDIYFVCHRIPLLDLLIWPGVVYCPFGIVAPLALAGMVLAWRRREGKGAGLMALFVFSYMAGVVPFFVTARFRLPVIPFLLPFASYCLVALFRERRSARIIIPLVMIGGFGLLINSNLAGYPRPALADSHTSMGHLYLERGQYRQAEEEFLRAISLEERYVRLSAPRLHAITGLARVYGETGRADRAIRMLTDAIARWPKSAGLHFQLGHLYYARGSLDEAIVRWQEAVMLDPKLHQVYLELGNAYEDKGQYAEAIAALRQSIGADPRYLPARFNLGLLYAKLGRVDEAEEQYRQAIQIDPGSADAHANLARLYAMEGGDLQEGFRLIKRALELDARNPAYWDILAQLYIERGEIERAREIFRRMIRGEPRNRYWRERLEEAEK